MPLYYSSCTLCEVTMNTTRSTRKYSMKLPQIKRSYYKYHHIEAFCLLDCQKNMSNEGGNNDPKTPKYSQYRVDSATWNRYLIQGWNCVLFNNPNPESWAPFLNDAGCGRTATIPHPEKGDLNNDIHPIFARENWVQEMEDELWHMLYPVLRLASKMLLSKAALAFFRRVLFGSARRGGGRTYLHYVAPEDPKDQEEEVLKCLNAVALKLRLLFAACASDPKKVDQPAQTHAAHCVSQQDFGKGYFLRGDLENLPKDDGQTHFLLINQAYADFFATYGDRERRQKTVSPSDLVRTTLSLAISLVHEIGHAFYARDRTDGDETYEEPYFDLEQHNDEVELGCALEVVMFGVIINAAVHPQHGAQLDWQPIVNELVGEYIVVIDENHLTFPMHPTWMHSLTTQAFWDQLERRPASKQLKGLFVRTDVTFGATLDVVKRHWIWRDTKSLLTIWGHRRNAAALAKKVTSRNQREKRKRAREPELSVAAGRYALRSKKQRVESMLSIAAAR